jgi:hypothetical protein
MIHCYITGVQCEIKDSYVLNRREARDLLDRLKDRVASLRRVLEQLSPLDDVEAREFAMAPKYMNFSAKKHRLVCKAVAKGMAPGFPEIKLFVTFEQYRANVRKTVLRGLREHPTLGKEVQDVDDAALLKADNMGKRVLHLLDDRRALPAKVRNAIVLGAVVRLRGQSAEEIAKLIRTTAASNGDGEAMGLTQAHLGAVRSLTQGGVAGS